MCISPKGELTIQVLAMPKDTNPSGDVFGGWIISQMDIAGAIVCKRLARGKIVTVAINSIVFKAPVSVGDTLSVYVNVIKRGKTSITVHIDAIVTRTSNIDNNEDSIFVTDGDFTYVKVDEFNKPIPL